MSRAAPRGRGRGGARVRGGRGGSQKIGGVQLSWDPDLDLDKPQPTPTFPIYKPPQPQPLTVQEKKQVAHFLALRKRIHQGPYYTVLGDNARVGKAGSKAAATFDPFEGIPKYTQKYMKKPRKLPDLTGRKYELKYFPQELHSTLDPSLHMTNGNTTAGQAKKPNPAKMRAMNGVDAADVGESKTGAEPEEDEGAPKEANAEDDDDPMEGEDVDDDFDEDDDDGGDYNAERYFDDGGDDIGEDVDGGYGDGGDYF